MLLPLLILSSSALAASIQKQPSPASLTRRSSRNYSSYNALGDSFSAGPGNLDQVGDNASGPDLGKDCYRHLNAWPALLANQLGIAPQQFTFSACSGFDTLQIREEEVIDEGPTFESPDLVTMTMGGNNNGSFSAVVLNCASVFPGKGKCSDALSKSNDTLNNPNMTAEIWATLNAAGTQNAVPGLQRTVVVLGYPVPFNSDTKANLKDPICGASPEQRGSINELGLRLNDMLRQAVQNATDTNVPYRAVYAEPNPIFNGHRVCELGGLEVEWFQSTVNFDDMEDGLKTLYNGFLHPNGAGHEALANVTLQALTT